MLAIFFGASIFAAVSLLAALVLLVVPRPGLRALRDVRRLMFVMAGIVAVVALGMLYVAGTDEGSGPLALASALLLWGIGWLLGRRKSALEARQKDLVPPTST